MKVAGYVCDYCPDGYDFPEEPQLRISSESKELRFFSKEEIADIEIAITHRDIVEELFLNR